VSGRLAALAACCAWLCAAAARADAPIVVIMGDSLVRDYVDVPVDIQGWGHELPRYFQAGNVVFQNDSVGHESTSSYIAEGRVSSALSTHPQFVFINFGLIDAFGESSYYFTDPNTYRANLHQMALATRAVGGEPIFVTPAPERHAAPDGVHVLRPNGLEPYADAMTAQGAADGVPVIDLQYWLLDQYDLLGMPEAQREYGFDQDGAPDVVHFSTNGADQVARHVASQLAQAAPGLAAFLVQTPAPALPRFALWGLAAALALAGSAAARARLR